MKKQDVINEFTEVVREYLNKGFVFLPEANRGSQGQEMAVVLGNGDDGIALSLFKQDITVKDHPYAYYYDSYIFYAESFSISEWKSKEVNFWLGNDRDYKVTTKVTYYNLNNVYNKGMDWFVVSEQKAVECKAKKLDRVKARRGSSKYNENKKFESKSAKELAFRIAKRTPGFKRVKLEDVKSFHKRCNDCSKVAYFIEFNVDSKFGCKKLALDKNLQKVDC